MSHELWLMAHGSWLMAHSSRPKRHAYAPLFAATIVAIAVIILRMGDTPLRDIALFAAYETCFVLLPGWLVYRAFSPLQSPMRQIAFGWAIGYVLEVLAFCLTAILNLRPLFAFYPLIPILLAILLLRRNRQSSALSNQHPALITQHLALSAVITLSLVYLGLSYFSETPLQFKAVTHHPDLIWQIGNIAEALRHVPLTDPRVVGEPLNYHNFVYYHMAAIAQVTGIELSIVLFRLYLVPMFIALALQLTILGQWLSGSRWVGIVTAALFFFCGEIGLQTTSANPYAFLNTLFTILWLSPTYTLGLVIFIPLIVEVGEALGTAFPRAHWGAPLLVLLLLLIGAEGAKAATLPVLLGGLALFLLVDGIIQRRIHWRGVGVFGLTLLVLGVFFFAIYRNSEAVSGFRPFNSILAMPAFQPLWPILSDLPRVLRLAITALAIPIGTFAHMPVQWLGLLITNYELRITNYKNLHTKRFIFLLALFATGMGAFLILSYSNLGQTYFILYAYPAACALAAQGIVQHLKQLKINRSAPKHSLGYPPIGLATIGLALCALLTVIDFPIDNMPKLTRWLRGDTTYSQEDRALTPELLAGLRWVRANTDINAVMAVNNQQLHPHFPGNGYYWYYSAYAERRVFLEGWVYTDLARRLGYTKIQDEALHPFPERAALNQRVFAQADAAALAEMSRNYGVRYLLVDKLHGAATPQLNMLGRVIFENTALVVYAVN